MESCLGTKANSRKEKKDNILDFVFLSWFLNSEISVRRRTAGIFESLKQSWNDRTDAIFQNRNGPNAVDSCVA